MLQQVWLVWKASSFEREVKCTWSYFFWWWCGWCSIHVVESCDGCEWDSHSQLCSHMGTSCVCESECSTLERSLDAGRVLSTRCCICSERRTISLSGSSWWILILVPSLQQEILVTLLSNLITMLWGRTDWTLCVCTSSTLYITFQWYVCHALPICLHISLSP